MQRGLSIGNQSPYFFSARVGFGQADHSRVSPPNIFQGAAGLREAGREADGEIIFTRNTSDSQKSTTCFVQRNRHVVVFGKQRPKFSRARLKANCYLHAHTFTNSWSADGFPDVENASAISSIWCAVSP